MPLPDDPKQTWPPATGSAADMAAWSAWYAGDTRLIAATAPDGPAVPASLASKFLGFWSRRKASAAAQAQQVNPVHAPLAADIAAVSADLLFGTFPDLQCEDDDTAARLDELVGLAGVQAAMLEAAEGAAALGGAYIRVAWDEDVANHPLLTVIHADHAIPEFRMGRLRAVTFWHEVAREDKRVWRFLERHEAGHILNGLYLGDAATLGDRVTLAARPETEDIEPDVTLPAGLPGPLTAFYVPNVLPNRKHRESPQGRADIAGAESFLDAFDELWSSLMRDVRVGQSRIIVPEDALQPTGSGRGGGKAFDIDREVFTGLDMDPEGAKVEIVQFAIRTADHISAALAVMERVVSAAGYSPQTFGLHIEGRAESGTALKLREGRTFQTIGRKQLYVAPQLAAAMEMMLAVDRLVFAGEATPERPAVVWPEERDSLSDVAATVNLLNAAEAASIETRVRMVNPDWSEDEVAEEVERIREEASAAVSAPTLPDPAFADLENPDEPGQGFVAPGDPAQAEE